MSTTTTDETTTDAEGTSTAGTPEGVGATDTPAGADVATTDASDEPDGESTDEPEDKGRSKASRDAARYRTQLRAVEAERDTLTARVEALQRTQVEALTAPTLSVAADLFDVGRVELASLLDDDGNVDRDKVQEATAALVKVRPGLGAIRRGPRPDPSQGGSGSASSNSSDASWSNFLSGGKRK